MGGRGEGRGGEGEVSIHVVLIGNVVDGSPIKQSEQGLSLPNSVNGLIDVDRRQRHIDRRLRNLPA